MQIGNLAIASWKRLPVKQVKQGLLFVAQI